MDETHSLLLNEEAFEACPEQKRSVFIYEWLRYLDRILPVTQREDIKNVQKELQQQLESRLHTVVGPPTRKLIARCIGRVYALTGDIASLNNLLNSCNDTLKIKDESPKAVQSKLAALACLAAVYDSMGRMAGRSIEDTLAIVKNWMGTAVAHSQAHIMDTLTSMAKALGSGDTVTHKKIHSIAKSSLQDRTSCKTPHVKIASLECLTALVPFYTSMYVTELEASCTIRAVAKFIAQLLSTAMKIPKGATMKGKSNQTISIHAPQVSEILNLLASGFLRGGIGGFLKTSSSTFSTTGRSDIRIGVSICYVEMVREMGSVWLEQHLNVVCSHLIDLAAKCGQMAYTQNASHVNEALIIRRCISFILRQTVGSLLGENAQTLACKHLGVLLSQCVDLVSIGTADKFDSSVDSSDYESGYTIIVILQEMSVLVRQIGSSVMSLFTEATGIMENIFKCLTHPLASARYSAAWCLRCIATAVPNLMTPLIDRCLQRLDQISSAPRAISGFSMALAALLAASTDSSKLGIPYAKPLKVLDLAEEMLRTATQQPKLTISKLESGWNLINSLIHLGPSVMKEHLPRVIRLWKAAFPRSAKEAESENNRGDAFSWQCAMVAQAGALSVMEAVASQPEFCSTNNTLEAMKVPIECSLVMMSQVGNLIKSYGNEMRQSNSVVRIRLYRLLLLLPHKSFEGSYVALLRELVADITLSDNSQSTMTTSLPMTQFTGVEKVLIAPLYNATDYAMVEDLVSFILQAPTSSVAVGNVEEDLSNLIRASASQIGDTWPENESEPLTCLNTALLTYGKVFPLVNHKHKLQITNHFYDTLQNMIKITPRKQAIFVNILTAKLLAYKTYCEQRGPKLEHQELQQSSSKLIYSSLSSSCPLTRLVGAEALARLSQAVGSPQYVAETAQYCFGMLNSCKDEVNRCGHVLALGCLHRHVGSLGSGQHLNTGVSVVLALAEESKMPKVQTSALVAMALIAETGSGMFRVFVETTLSSCLKLLISTPTFVVDVVQGISKCVSIPYSIHVVSFNFQLTALITCVGPELSCPGVIDGVRTSLLAACAIQMSHSDPSVQAEAISGLQQMHLFAPRYVHMAQLVVDISSLLSSTDLVIRKQAVSCLRQLVQRESKEVRNHAQVLVPQGIVDTNKKKFALPESGLEGALFGMLDTEVNKELRCHLQETLISLVQGTSGELLNNWLMLCKEILATSNDHGLIRKKEEKKERIEGDGDDDENEDGDDDTNLAGISSLMEEDKGKVQPRWPTKVFTMEIVNRLMSVCDTERAHLDMALAKELQNTSGGKNDYLVLHLSDLVRMSFMAATSDNSSLRIAGLKSLEEVIIRFSSCPEPEFPGHMILEQFQAQVGAALRPAFTDDTPSNVTSVACQVCSTWIGSGVARDLNDLKRVHQLLVSSLNKLKQGSINVQLYSESAATLEKLSILKAWAEVYVTAIEQDCMKNENEEARDHYEYNGSGSLLSLVEPETNTLIAYWLAILNDAALLALPAHYSEQILTRGGAFFNAHSAEACREYYQLCWPPILLACSTWLSKNNFELPSGIELSPETASVWRDEGNISRFYLLIGIAVESLSNKTRQIEDETIQMSVKSLTRLLSCEWCQMHLMSDVPAVIEILYVLHRSVLTRDCLSTQLQCIECVGSIMDAAQLSMRICASRDISNGNMESVDTLRKIPNVLFGGAEGGNNGQIINKDGVKTISYAVMELAVCAIFKQMPQINSAQLKANSLAALHLRKVGRLPAESTHLVIKSMQILIQIPNLCSPQAKITVLPVVMYLLIGFVRESARLDEGSIQTDRAGHLSAIAAAAIQSIRSIVSQPPDDETTVSWKNIMRNAFYSVLNMTEDNERIQLDKCIIMLAAVVFTTSAPVDVVLGHQESFSKLVILLKRHLQSDNVAVLMKTLQSLTSIFGRKGFGGIFVKYLGKEIMPIVKRYTLKVDSENEKITESDLAILQECVKVIEVLALNARDGKRIHVISLLVQLLVRLLRATSHTEWRKVGPIEKKLHEMAIGRLNAAASMWPNDFKRVIDWNQELKARLESALNLQSSRHAHQISMTKTQEAKTTSVVHQPRISLKMFGAENN
ncbi:hypothetical protein CAEBREN_32553 [Caenorhabditis brenneri]|uniref:HEAT repeat-containing protein 5B n=1 Tax=Caenorhabditis brenneri TaxID=135651 RepID=G0PMD9_CAEBE|nr:hypothetical protein CAEBREN_32553 [Caenorhabditis brenneri]